MSLENMIVNPVGGQSWRDEVGFNPHMWVYTRRQRKTYYRQKEIDNLKAYIANLGNVSGYDYAYEKGQHVRKPSIVEQMRAIDPDNSITKDYDKALQKLRQMKVAGFRKGGEICSHVISCSETPAFPLFEPKGKSLFHMLRHLLA